MTRATHSSVIVLVNLFVFIVFSSIVPSTSAHDAPHQEVFHNQFAIHVPEGQVAADRIAAKYGFTNLGQVRKKQPYMCALGVY